ncbi:MAG TPA: SDR family oxidoreductase [Gemmatimonadaceae bacterium]|jgi:short-subunit dehydrogenase|nr:SDR family oxidoreductase [Gemmatimonadaceae bacterium]
MTDRTIVITGASAGIGAALAERLSARGDRVALVARREAELRAVAARCGTNALSHVADVTSREAVKRVVSDTIAHFGHVDVWVNNVGRGISRLVSQLSDGDLDEMMRVNVRTALYGMQEVLPHFIERGSGHIINVSSMLGRVPMFAPRSAYSASKHFLNAITANLRDEMREQHPGIQVSLVSPGIVATEFGKNAVYGGVDSRAMPMAQPVEEVAEVIAQVIDTRAPDVYTRPGMRQSVIDYYSRLGADPS